MVVDVELDEDVVVDALHPDVVEPGVDVSGLRLGLERRTGLVPRGPALAREVAHAVLGRERLHVGVAALVQHPAVVRVAHARQRLELRGDHVERLVRRHAQGDHRHPAAGRRHDVHGAPHPPDEEPVEARQDGRQVRERDGGREIEPQRAVVLRAQPPGPEARHDHQPQQRQRPVDRALVARERGQRADGARRELARGASRRDRFADRRAAPAADAGERRAHGEYPPHP